MTAIELTSLVAQLLYVAVFVRVLVDVVRRPRPANVDAAFFFGILTVIVVIAQGLRFFGVALSPAATTTLVVVLLALPYSLLRLADDYRGVRRWIKVAAGAGLVVSIALAVFSFFVVGLWRWALLLFVVGWILQFIGHYFEKKPPEFFKDPRFLFVGVRWWLAKMRGKA